MEQFSKEHELKSWYPRWLQVSRPDDKDQLEFSTSRSSNRIKKSLVSYGLWVDSLNLEDCDIDLEDDDDQA